MKKMGSTDQLAARDFSPGAPAQAKMSPESPIRPESAAWRVESAHREC